MVPARADEFKPGYLQLTQLDRETYDVLWKIPAIDESTTLKVKPQFSTGPRRSRRCAAPSRAAPCSAGASVCRKGSTGRPSLLAALGNPDRRARAARAPGRHRAARAHPAGEPQLRRGPALVDWKSSRPIRSSGSNTSCPGSITCCSCSLWCSWCGTRRLLVTITAFTRRTA